MKNARTAVKRDEWSFFDLEWLVNSKLLQTKRAKVFILGPMYNYFIIFASPPGGNCGE